MAVTKIQRRASNALSGSMGRSFRDGLDNPEKTKESLSRLVPIFTRRIMRHAKAGLIHERAHRHGAPGEALLHYDWGNVTSGGIGVKRRQYIQFEVVKGRDFFVHIKKNRLRGGIFVSRFLVFDWSSFIGRLRSTSVVAEFDSATRTTVRGRSQTPSQRIAYRHV